LRIGAWESLVIRQHGALENVGSSPTAPTDIATGPGDGSARCPVA
jgi:hypothetical protein